MGREAYIVSMDDTSSCDKCITNYMFLMEEDANPKKVLQRVFGRIPEGPLYSLWNGYDEKEQEKRINVHLCELCVQAYQLVPTTCQMCKNLHIVKDCEKCLMKTCVDEKYGCGGCKCEEFAST